MAPILNAFGNPLEDPPPETEGIRLATREGSHIDNFQCTDELTRLDIDSMRRLEAKYPLIRRTPPNAIYNCHGFVFACRRTAITEPPIIRKILAEDRYEEVAVRDVLPGDVVVYFGDNGDVEHSGLVVEKAGESYQPPVIVSKWGKGPEYIHCATQCPYNLNTKYYRVLA